MASSRRLRINNIISAFGTVLFLGVEFPELELVRDHFWRYPAGPLAGLISMEYLVQYAWERKVKQEEYNEIVKFITRYCNAKV